MQVKCEKTVDLTTAKPSVEEVSIMIAMAITENTKNMVSVLAKMIPNFDKEEFARLLTEETIKSMPAEVIEKSMEEIYGRKS